MKFFEVRTPWFRPLWRRILVFGVTAIWSAVELLHGNPGFALLFGAAAAWLAWQFFFVFDQAD